ncbi:MAG TPA: hypothetical protein IAC37_05715 [Candidatus Ventrimonas merdavium]|nr:hypothetical protein [Candidatus Ventrimonas merdavium]
MATSSIKKSFVVKSNEACDKLIKEYENRTQQAANSKKSYEEGKRKLEQYFGR